MAALPHFWLRRLLVLSIGFISTASCTDPSAPSVAKLEFLMGPGTIGAGVEFPIQVALKDENGQLVQSARDSITLYLDTAPEGGAIIGTTTVTAVDGIARFIPLRILRSGTYKLGARAPGLPAVISPAFSVLTGPDARLLFSLQPQGALARTVMPSFSVSIVDPYGNPSANFGRNVSLSLGTAAIDADAGLGGNVVRQAANGVADFTNVTIRKPGTGYVFFATSPGLQSTVSAPFEMRTGAPARLTFTAQPETGITGVPLIPIMVAIEDSVGNTIANQVYSISLSIGAGASGAQLLGTTTVNTVQGVATFSDVRVDAPAGVFSLVASSSALSATATSNTFAMRSAVSFNTVTSGYFHSCGMGRDQTTYCWGLNDAGQLATTGDRRTFPTAISGPVAFSKVSSGRSHSCGLTSSGAAYCWGDNAAGQLGIGSLQNQNTPVLVSGAIVFADVQAAYDHTCGVTTAGAAYCWGDNTYGELGVTGPSSTVPLAVSGGRKFSSISAGRFFTCGVTTTGDAYCWGDNSQGYLGDGSTTRSFFPVPVSGNLKFVAVSAGGFHVCGLTTEGSAYCWGSNGWSVIGPGGPGSVFVVPTKIPGELKFASLSAGNRHNCAVTDAGVAYCWGDNTDGKIGDGTTTMRAAPTQVSGDIVFASVSAGRFHSCGVSTSNVAYCWGANYGGYLGNGTTTNSPGPVIAR